MFKRHWYWTWGRSLSPRQKRHLWEEIRARQDFAVLGRFNRLQPSSAPLRSSRSQILRLFSDRYTEADFGEQLVEVHVDGTGRAEVTGFPILGLPWYSDGLPGLRLLECEIRRRFLEAYRNRRQLS